MAAAPDHRPASTSPFGATPQDIAELITAHPLAWIVATTTAGPVAALLPLVPIVDDAGQVSAIEGHVPRAHPLHGALQSVPEALLLWLGPHGYISPSWMTDRTQAPTWNFASVQCRARIDLVDDADTLRRHLVDLVGRHEAGRPNAWHPEDMGARYELLAARVIAFRAQPLQWLPRFKLGQDERDDVYADIAAGLARSPLPSDAELALSMHRHNAGRPAAVDAADGSRAAPRPDRDTT